MESSSLATAFARVKEQINVASANKENVRLVAVTKRKLSSVVIEAYELGQRHFGENYISELIVKSQDQEIVEFCTDIKWHLIGPLQVDRVDEALCVTNLYMVQTIYSEELAYALNNIVSEMSHKLKVMVQVNTNKKTFKVGVLPEKCTDLVRYICHFCPNLEFVGLMTNGSFSHNISKGSNPNFDTLLLCRKKLCEELPFIESEIELSMGLSHDFEHAIKLGSTSVRVGSAIFGSWNYPRTFEEAAALQKAEQGGER